MALDVEHGSFIKQSGTGNQTITMSGSFTPKLVIFFGDGYHTADGIVNDYYGPFWGFTSTTESLSFSASVQSDNKNGQAGLHDGCILILDEDATTEAEADIVSMSSGQFVINWTTNANTTACRIFYIAIGGSDLTDIKIGAGALNTGTGNQSFSSITSFTPKIGFFASVHGITTFPTSSIGNTGISFGTAVSSSKRHCIGHPTKGDRGRGVFDDTKIIVNGTSDAALDTEVDFVSFNSDGFTVNIVDAPPAAHQLGYVLLGGSFTADVGTLTSPLSTGTQQITTTDEPSLVGLYTMLTLVGDVWGDNYVQVSFGAGVSATARSNHTYTNPDNKAPESASDDAFVIQGYLAANPLTASTEDADIDSFNATDFTLDWTKADTGNAFEYGWWMFGATSGDIEVIADIDTLVLTEYPATLTLDVDVQAGVDELTLTEYPATVSVTADVEVQAGVDELVLTSYPATLSLDVDVQAGVDELTLTTYPASIQLGVNVQAGVDELTLTSYSAAVSADIDVQAGIDELVLTSYPAEIQLGVNVQAGVDTLTLAAYPATVTFDVDIQAGVDELALTAYSAAISLDVDVQAGVDELTLTPYPASIQLGVNVLAGVDTLTLAAYPATLTLDVDVQAGVDVLTLTTYPATISIGVDVNVNAGVDALVLTAYPAEIAFGANVLAGIDALALTTYPASIILDVNILAGVDELVLTTYNVAIISEIGAPFTVVSTHGYIQSTVSAYEYIQPTISVKERA